VSLKYELCYKRGVTSRTETVMYTSDIFQANERCFEMKENFKKKYVGMIFILAFWVLRRDEVVEIYEIS
jgi:hypothetical protein